VSRPRLGVRAFRTVCNDLASIVFAESPQRARYATYLAAKDAGFNSPLHCITVKRAPTFDVRRTKHGGIPVSFKPLCAEMLQQDGNVMLAADVDAAVGGPAPVEDGDGRG
jgi:hypothetical protein